MTSTPRRLGAEDDPSTKLWLEVCEKLGIASEHVLFGSMTAQGGEGDGHQVRVTWSGVGFMPEDEFEEIVARHVTGRDRSEP